MIAVALACQLALAPSSGTTSPARDEPLPAEAHVAASERSFLRSPALPAAMSLIVPGSGQVLQGRVERGVWHLGAAAALGLLMFNAESQQANVSGVASSGANVRSLSAAALLGLAVWSPLDAWLFGTNDPKRE